MGNYNSLKQAGLQRAQTSSVMKVWKKSHDLIAEDGGNAKWVVEKGHSHTS